MTYNTSNSTTGNVSHHRSNQSQPQLVPGISPGPKSDGPDYLAMLKELRRKLPKGKTLSIAAPATLCHPKPQYNFHNVSGQEGCPDGNCRRSHAHWTETQYPLALITKNMIAVGLSSYGQSFGMARPGCTGPTSPSGGKKSKVTKGRGTGTAGSIY
ncbi:hypothetical protein CDD83_1960 [Cordyceps sp. RAO-2017]|nr:hypothetical protein CDD83_1960 [Cordyceps sp. RAO-2017]